jgi:uncharacterized protein YmfQ (DUF2313 family)
VAFEDVYAEVLSTSHVKGTYDESNDSYLLVLKALLPLGPAWIFEAGSEMLNLLEGMSYSFLRVANRAKDLLEEFDPRTTFELLPDWERVLGLPGTNPTPPTTLAARRAAVHSKLLGNGDPTPEFFEDIAVAQGYTAAHVNQNYLGPFVPGSVAGDPVASGWQFVWEMVTSRGDDDVLLQWMLESLTPEHTKLMMFWLINLAQQSFDSSTVAFRGIKYNGADLWCAVGSVGSIQTSPNGEDWTKQTAAGAYTGNFFDVSYDTVNSLWCAVGTGGEIQTSVDGETWIQQTAAGAFAGVFYGIEHDQSGLWTAVGASGEIQTSVDGAMWIQRTAMGGYTATWYGVAYNANAGRWVAAGTDTGSPFEGKLNVSTDGETWVDQAPIGTPDGFREVRYDGSGQLIVVGSDTAVQTSANGLDWRARAVHADILPSNDLVAVTYAGNRWVIIGQSGECLETWLGADMKRHVLGFTSPYAIGYGDGKVILVGASGGVYTSEA